MFPPIDEAILQSNPDFANLYNKLTNVVLNPDGSTREDPAVKERQRVKDELEKHRLQAAKQHLLTQALSSLTPPPPSRSLNPRQSQRPTLPEPLLDLLLILPPLLAPSGPGVAEDEVSLLLSSPPLTELDDLMPDLTSLLSSHLRSSALNLARITHLSTNPSYLHRHIPALATSFASLTQQERDAHQSLVKAPLEALSKLLELMDLYVCCLTKLIRTLESKHGVIARNLDLRATEASLEARHVHQNVEMALHTTTGEVYSSDAMAALNKYALHLKDAKARTGERIKSLTAELGDYGVGVPGGEAKERTMREMARVYRDMARQVEDAKGDLKRLQQRG
ncbi:uncharacterized protein F5Z01DRAFT_694947 [Emericellopsis atlantica]|uniref:Uncharacterized protein n=1 Tax=Emericellopsis atlantica TaxID=2614577 RepID=A0A9P8CSB7_9HYPO|nr:uncharacterized protein F5Z01DRAFT_694947 [Emericellopsis atlantica]KAG9257638.1 hypothetical protein F5Z01DRAFT_694947 [Emericellopsis atlantica]